MTDANEALARWLERTFGPDVTAAQHEDPMRAEDWLSLAGSALHAIEQAAEAVDREAAGAMEPNPEQGQPSVTPSAAVAPLGCRHPSIHPIDPWPDGPAWACDRCGVPFSPGPSAVVAHDPTICTGTDAVPCGCVCFDCNERGIHQAAEAKTRVATVPAESHTAVASAAAAYADADPEAVAWMLQDIDARIHDFLRRLVPSECPVCGHSLEGGSHEHWGMIYEKPVYPTGPIAPSNSAVEEQS